MRIHCYSALKIPTDVVNVVTRSPLLLKVQLFLWWTDADADAVLFFCADLEDLFSLLQVWFAACFCW